MKAPKHSFYLSVITASLLSACTPTLQSMQPAIVHGGRAVSISTNIANDNNVIVASESGGLFRSTNGAVTWHQVSGSATFWFNDVKYYPPNPNIIIAVANPDTKTTNSGGVWRSTNGGSIWSHISIPPGAGGCSTDLAGYCIDVEPGANRIWVGTNCGLAFSDDAGATWAYLNAVSGYNHEKVIAVLAPLTGNLKILTDAGLRISSDGGAHWSVSNTGFPPFVSKDVHNEIACSPFNDHHIFLAANFWGNDNAWHKGLFLSTNNGSSWSNLITIDGLPNRPPFVKIAHNLAGNTNQFDVYFSDGGCTFRRASFTNGTTPSITGTWANLSFDHCDGSDLTFRGDGKTPFILASDGGLSNTTDNGANWHLYAGGIHGYNALQMTEGTGQLHSTPGMSDLYFSTQDNNTWASPDNGATWPASACCEGFFLRIPRNSLPASQSKLTFVSCGPCGNLISGPILSGVGGFANPPLDNGNPCLLSPGNYVQNTRISGVTASIFALTNNNGASWSSRYGFPEDVRDLSKVAGPPGSPVIFTAIRRPGSTPGGDEMVGIKKIVGTLAVGAPIVSDVTGFGSLGIFPTMFAWYKPFGADMHDPNHLIVPDIITRFVKVTFDGGLTWADDSILTNLVTQSGAFKFNWGPFTQITNIAFDPQMTGHILVGTNQAGIFRSCDNGTNWTKIFGTEIIPEVSSFYFMGANKVMVTSYGRGMWKLNLTACRTRIVTPNLRLLAEEPVILYQGVWIPLSQIHNPDVCPRCVFFIVNNGDIRSYELSPEKNEVTSVTLSSGTINGFLGMDGSKTDLPFQVNISEKEGNLRNDIQLRDMMMKRDYKIKGIYLDGNIFKGIILAKTDIAPGQLPRQEAPKANIYVRVLKNNVIEITGSGFDRNTPIVITIDGKRIELNEKPKFNEKGNFVLVLNLPLSMGGHKLLVEQETRGKQIREVATFIISVADEKPENK